MSIFSVADFLDRVRTTPELSARMAREAFQKGDYIFRQGEICPDVFILVSGLVKLHYLTLEGKEWVKSFIMDEGVFGSRVSQSLGQPSTFFVTCLEASVVCRLPYKEFEAMCLRDADLGVMMAHFNQWLSLKKELREYELLCLSAEERYRNFLDTNPALCGRITQIDMARYLGITPIALSRIKGRGTKKPA